MDPQVPMCRACGMEAVDYFPNGRPYVLKEARRAEALAGESRKLADESGDLLRKAREVVSGSPGGMQRLRRG